MKDNIHVIILAAGHSSRMGKPKAMLDFLNGTTFLETIIQTYKKINAKIILVTNQTVANDIENYEINYSDISIVINNEIDKGRMHSIKLGCELIKDSSICFIQNIDNPFVEIDTLNKLLTKIDFNNYVSPTYKNKGGHPILLSSQIISDLKSNQKLDLTLKDFLKNYTKTKIETDTNKIHTNINTLEEYKKIFDIK